MNGVVQLYSWDGGMLAQSKYDCVKNRKRIMEIWKRRYAKNYIHCFYIIIPHTNDRMIRDNGENHRAKKQLEI